MKFGKRRQDADTPDTPEAAAGPAPPPVTDSWTAPRAAQPAAEPVVEGEAVELPPVEPAAPVYEPPVPLTLQGSASTPDPAAAAADQPVTAAGWAAGPGSGGTPVTSLGDSGEAFASGHAAAPGPSWQEPLIELADERPELVVGAAFAGGILAAMILRRLGS